MAAAIAWRAMSSLLVLRDQANRAAPRRSRASDGLVGDPAHQSRESDHNPHSVPGVGPAMVTALDLTHDPAGGFDSYTLAETLRLNREKRIKYVISNGRIFSSYAVTVDGKTIPPWTWRRYSGADQHEGHVHVSVLDNAASDTDTPWNLEGFMTQPMWAEQYTPGFFVQAMAEMKTTVTIPAAPASKVIGGYKGFTGTIDLVVSIRAMQADIAAIRKALAGAGGGGGSDQAVLDAVAEVDARVNQLIDGVRANAAALAEPTP